MGADAYVKVQIGRFKDAVDAHRAAVEDALYEHGHGGYTGTIAETHSCKPSQQIVGPKATLSKLEELAWQHAWECDKWGPAQYFEVTNKAEVKRIKERYGLKNKKGIRVFVFYGCAPC